MTNFGNLKSSDGVKALNDYLGDKSYIEGFSPSQADVSVYESIGKAPAENFAHALRWFNHIASFVVEKFKFPGEKKALSNGPAPAPVAAAAPAAPPAAAPADDDDDDEEVDLFGSDDEEEDPDAARVREERLAAYAAKKAVKPGPIAKSQILLDCKPWDDETDMKAMEE
ncbi:hypothetical protein CGJ15_25470, partial [Vibrio parahaemolyticus]